MSSNPYENEPGFENSVKEGKDKANMEEYVNKIRHEALRITIIQRLEEYLNLDTDGMVRPPAPLEPLDPDAPPPEPPFEPFKDMIKQRFLWYYDTYLASIAKESAKVKLNQNFKLMPFEHSGNAMDGKYNYDELERRLKNIKRELTNEVERWVKDGEIANKQDDAVAVNLRRQFEQCVAHFKKESVPLDIELVNGNPFNWRLVRTANPGFLSIPNKPSPTLESLCPTWMEDFSTCQLYTVRGSPRSNQE